MDASARARSCASCGAVLSADARFCPTCGEVADAEEQTTVREPVPVDETGRVPVTIAHAQPRWFGLTPPLVSLIAALAAVVAAALLFAVGLWPFGLILLGVAALFVALLVEVSRRKPDLAPVQLPTEAIAHVRERAGAAVEQVAARGRATAELLRLRREHATLLERRQHLLAELGAAVYAEDGIRVDHVRFEVDQVEDQVRRVEAAMDEVVAATEERVESARLAVQETQMVELPEPYPPPDEGNPPGPAIVPEPSPPPDEITPPQPDPVPTPLGPGQDD
jgi:hypothetical protein